MQIEFLKLINQGGIVSIIVAAILLTMSIASWTIMIVKAIQLRRLRRLNTDFVASLKSTDCQPPASLKSNALDFTSGMIFGQNSMKIAIDACISAQPSQIFSPFARLTFHGFRASEHHRLCAGNKTNNAHQRDEFIGRTLRRTINNEALNLESGLTLLASIGSIAPFIGLFGTVWGIYHALGAIAVGGQATVDKVAGPVGEALIMTAFGLAVAMPAVLAYNSLIRDNRLLMAELENYAHDLFASLTLGMFQDGKPDTRTASGKTTMAVVS